jgi:Na+-translocating ferredoxin:NAD+ oxidoreductase RNF subunit RnfB
MQETVDQRGDIMTDVYKRLAQKMDGLPQGYPATASGIELKILRKIYSEEEAEMALKIRPIPETAETIARRLEKPVPEMESILDDMVGKGQIGSFKLFGEQVYMFFPFVIGVYEFQLDRMDKELTEMFEEYAPRLLKEFGGYAPASARVVPIGKDVDADLLIHRYEDVRGMIEDAKSFRVMNCICRKERELEGHPCVYPVEVCLSFSQEEGAFEKDPRGRVISQEEAFAVLDQAGEAGLVHCTYNVQSGHAFVCNCCPCCCGILRGVKEYKSPYILAKSNFVAVIDQDDCVQCGVCANERCPMEAIVEDADGFEVLPERCIGCGACIASCTTEAIRLVRRPESEQDTPPKDLMDWTQKRAATRGVELKLD